MNFKEGWLRALTALSVMAVSAVSMPLQADQSLVELFEDGKFAYSLRYRLEGVDQDGFDEDALASTMRMRMNFKGGGETGFGFFVEGDLVLEIGADDYNAGGGNTPDRGEYPVIADPDGEDLNQAYFDWRSQGGTLLRAGRQRIIMDNARFVGNVGWRQNEQTYDGVYVQHKAGGFDLQATWIDQVNRIFGNDVDAGEHNNNTWLLNASKTWKNYGKLAAYYYDIENKDAAAFSTSTVGMRYTNKHANENFTLAYSADLAHQSDANNAPVDYSANYYRFDLSLGSKLFSPYLGYEVLTGDADKSGTAFRTPLATLHAFNGWADKFLGTPDAGLKDLFVGVKGSVAGWNWNVVYHDFKAEDGDADFGEELDASVGRSFAKQYGLLFKVAHFDGDTGSSYADTTKFWIQATASF
jgi:hypothetical protein